MTSDPLRREDGARRYSPLKQMMLARIREFIREPEAIFWVYVFPLLMLLALGIAFRNRPIETSTVDICDALGAEQTAAALAEQATIAASVHPRATCFARLRTGKTELVVVVHQLSEPSYEYHFDPTKPGSLVTRDAVDRILQRAAGRRDRAQTDNVEHTEPGGRYIDFLVPGLLGMGLMGGGLWGIGFVIVDMRIRNLLKRLVATPMKKHVFLAGVMISRLLGMIPEVLLLLIFSWLVFGVRIHGSLLSTLALICLGAVMFAGIGLLVASRARTLEAVSGLMNLAMLPMWILSGIFFSSERFPQAAQPFIKILPLTALIDSLRAVMLDGAPLGSLGTELVIMGLWTSLSFLLALKWFRWV